jgi:high frequency lysogenization protein
VNRIENQVLALAGMFQAAAVIDELAFGGSLDEAAFEASLDSLFTFEAENPRQVFGGVEKLERGFRALEAYLGGDLAGGSRNIAYYVLSMMKIALRLSRDDELSRAMLVRLHDIQRSGRDFRMSRSALVIKIDGLYQESISNLRPRIMVAGEQNYLTNNDTAARVRTLLLAGIRAAVLWRQLGGSKWKLLFSRKRYVAVARYLAESCQESAC